MHCTSVQTRCSCAPAPESALEFDGDDTYVQVLAADGSTTRTKVETGLSDGVNIEIKSGVTEGTKVRGSKIVE